VLPLLVALILWLGGLQLVALGIVGQCVWRAFDEARQRPARVIETDTEAVGLPPAALCLLD
jgi:chromate transport protein ChrA